jgi:NADP-dependent 3-hydroxy acid dehydrogenase YdfG
MGRKLDGVVVVITGASSGTGRRPGLGSLNEGHEWWWPRCRADALEELAGECQAAGGQAPI